jgi:hypothetical protein
MSPAIFQSVTAAVKARPPTAGAASSGRGEVDHGAAHRIEGAPSHAGDHAGFAPEPVVDDPPGDLRVGLACCSAIRANGSAAVVRSASMPRPRTPFTISRRSRTSWPAAGTWSIRRSRSPGRPHAGLRVHYLLFRLVSGPEIAKTLLVCLQVLVSGLSVYYFGLIMLIAHPPPQRFLPEPGALRGRRCSWPTGTTADDGEPGHLQHHLLLLPSARSPRGGRAAGTCSSQASGSPTWCSCARSPRR